MKLEVGGKKCMACGFNLEDPHIEGTHHCPYCGEVVEQEGVLAHPECERLNKPKTEAGDGTTYRRRVGAGRESLSSMARGVISLRNASVKSLLYQKPLISLLILFTILYVIYGYIDIAVSYYFTKTHLSFGGYAIENSTPLALKFLLSLAGFTLWSIVAQFFLMNLGGHGMLSETMTSHALIGFMFYVLSGGFNLLMHPLGEVIHTHPLLGSLPLLAAFTGFLAIAAYFMSILVYCLGCCHKIGWERIFLSEIFSIASSYAFIYVIVDSVGVPVNLPGLV